MESEAIERYVLKQKETTVAGLQRALGISYGEARAALASLVEQGKCRYEGGLRFVCTVEDLAEKSEDDGFDIDDFLEQLRGMTREEAEAFGRETEDEDEDEDEDDEDLSVGPTDDEEEYPVPEIEEIEDDEDPTDGVPEDDDEDEDVEDDDDDDDDYGAEAHTVSELSALLQERARMLREAVGAAARREKKTIEGEGTPETTEEPDEAPRRFVRAYRPGEEYGVLETYVRNIETGVNVKREGNRVRVNADVFRKNGLRGYVFYEYLGTVYVSDDCAIAEYFRLKRPGQKEDELRALCERNGLSMAVNGEIRMTAEDASDAFGSLIRMHVAVQKLLSELV